MQNYWSEMMDETRVELHPTLMPVAKFDDGILQRTVHSSPQTNQSRRRTKRALKRPAISEPTNVYRNLNWLKSIEMCRCSNPIPRSFEG